MPVFLYQARDSAGTTQDGEIEAQNVRKAVQTLIERQLTVLFIKEKRGEGDSVIRSGSAVPIAVALLGTLALLAWHFLH